MQIVLYVTHVRKGGGVVREDDSLCKRRHATKGKAMPQVVREKRISREKVMFTKERIKSIWIVRV